MPRRPPAAMITQGSRFCPDCFETFQDTDIAILLMLHMFQVFHISSRNMKRFPLGARAHLKLHEVNAVGFLLTQFGSWNPNLIDPTVPSHAIPISQSQFSPALWASLNRDSGKQSSGIKRISSAFCFCLLVFGCFS